MPSFRDDDQGFLAWIETNRDNGLVVNHYRHPTPSYLMLHRASYHTLRTRPHATSTDYGKECSLSLEDLAAFARAHGGILQPCMICNPQDHL